MSIDQLPKPVLYLILDRLDGPSLSRFLSTKKHYEKLRSEEVIRKMFVNSFGYPPTLSFEDLKNKLQLLSKFKQLASAQWRMETDYNSLKKIPKANKNLLAESFKQSKVECPSQLPEFICFDTGDETAEKKLATLVAKTEKGNFVWDSTTMYWLKNGEGSDEVLGSITNLPPTCVDICVLTELHCAISIHRTHGKRLLMLLDFDKNASLHTISMDTLDKSWSIDGISVDQRRIYLHSMKKAPLDAIIYSSELNYIQS